jgi:hypothetical protein
LNPSPAAEIERSKADTGNDNVRPSDRKVEFVDYENRLSSRPAKKLAGMVKQDPVDLELSAWDAGPRGPIRNSSIQPKRGHESILETRRTPTRLGKIARQA